MFPEPVSSSRGRVTGLLPQARGFDLFGSENARHEEGMRGIPNTPLSDLFFSRLNVEALQHGIRYSVYKRTQKVIGNQSEEELVTIMRSIYYQHAENRAHDIKAQVRALNAYVLEFAVDRIIGEMRMQQSYLRDISQLPTPIPRSINTSLRGTRVLELTDL